MEPLPIPRLPVRLPGETWGLAAYFNPAGYASKLDNLRRFAGGVRRQGLPLLLVELAFGDAPFVLEPGLCERLLRLRTGTVLWQKERMLNRGLAELPAACDKVVWLDADILFEADDWVASTAHLLESYVVVQPYETACWLPPGTDRLASAEDLAGSPGTACLAGIAATMARAADRRKILLNYFDHGHTGFAWAARRGVLERHGFYDRQILGNGDFVMAHAMFGDEDFLRGRNWQCRWLSRRQLAHIAEWSRSFYHDVQGSVGHTEGRVLHLWHGEPARRRYNERLQILKDEEFDPATDVVEDAGGCWSWGSDKPRLHRRVREYFRERSEDG